MFYDKSGKPIQGDVATLQGQVIAGTALPKKGTSYNLRDESGESFSVDGSELPQALTNGYRLETPEEMSVRQYVNDNKGIKGTIKVGGGQFIDEALGGIPELIMDKTADPLDLAKKEALKKQHSAANTIGGVAGFGASLFGPGPLSALSKVGTKAGTAVAEKAITKLATDSVAKSILKNAAQKTIATGIEGAMFSAPTAVTEAMLGDLDHAAETMVAGGLIGGVFGGGGSLIKDLGKLGAEKATKGLLKFGGVDEDIIGELSSKFGDPKFAGLRKSVVDKDFGSFNQHLDELYPNSAGNKVQNQQLFDGILHQFKANPSVTNNEILAGLGLEFIMPGLGKIAALGKAGQMAYNAAKDPTKVLNGVVMVEKAMGMAGKMLDSKLGQALNKPTQITYTAMRDLVGDGSEKEQYGKMVDMVANVNNDPIGTTDRIGKMIGGLREDAPNLQDKINLQLLQSIKYIDEIMPKSKRYQNPLFKNNAYVPSDAEMNKFKQQLEIIVSPFKAVDALGAGTLSKSQVKVLEVLYPQLLSSIRMKVTDSLAKSNKPFKYSEKLKINRLLGISTDYSLQPNTIKGLQNSFTPAAQQATPRASGAKIEVGPNNSPIDEMFKGDKPRG